MSELVDMFYFHYRILSFYNSHNSRMILSKILEFENNVRKYSLNTVQ